MSHRLNHGDKATKAQETVNHPSHYQSDNLETIEVIDEFKLNFNLGNTIKYILRCGRKTDAIEDLQKAQWYIKREIDKRMKESYERTDAAKVQEFHKSAERIAQLQAAENFREAMQHGEETGVY